MNSRRGQRFCLSLKTAKCLSFGNISRAQIGLWMKPPGVRVILRQNHQRRLSNENCVKKQGMSRKKLFFWEMDSSIQEIQQQSFIAFLQQAAKKLVSRN